MPFVTSDKAQLWFATAGEGSPIVLVHGGVLEPMDGARFWIEPGIADALAGAGFHVLIPDRRFSGGRTIAPIDVHTWDIETNDLQQVLDTAGADKAHVVAGSNGISAAIRFTRHFSSRVLSLILCWPTPPANDRVHAAFDHARSIIAESGPSTYVEIAEGRHGVLAARSLLFQHVLEHGDAVATSFSRLTATEATRILTSTEHFLLEGGVLRGVSEDDLERLGQCPLPIAIVPADPEDPNHTRAIADRLASGIVGSMLLPGTPVSPSPLFPAHRDRFATQLIEHLRSSPSSPD